MNFYIWFEQSKLIPLFEAESGTLSLPDHCLFWPDQRLDVSQSKCKLGYPPVVKRGMLENPPFIEDGLLEFWNLHIYSGFSSTPCSCLHRKFLVLAGRWAPGSFRSFLGRSLGPCFWRPCPPLEFSNYGRFDSMIKLLFGTETIRMRWNDSGGAYKDIFCHVSRHVSK